MITDHWSLITSVLGRSKEISPSHVLSRLKSRRINSPYVVLYQENSRKMPLRLHRLWWHWWHWCLPQRLAQIAQEACSPQLCNKPSANHTQRQALHNLKFTYLCLNIFMITPNTRERRGQVNIDLKTTIFISSGWTVGTIEDPKCSLPVPRLSVLGSILSTWRSTQSCPS